MKERTGNPRLIYEEKKAIKLFLLLFNVIYFSYDIFSYYISPIYIEQASSVAPRDGLGLYIYLLMLGILVISSYIIKKGNLYNVKFFYLISFLCIDIVDNTLRYLGTTKTFASGNIVEIFFFLYLPIFVNKKYFWFVTLGLISKDLILGLILQDLYVLYPVVIFILLAAISYILLIRFYSYINTLTSVYEELRQKEKLAVIGQMATAIGHEIRNPLASLKGFTQLQQERNPNTNNFYPIMIQEIDRINSIVNDLMYLGKPKEIQFKKSGIEEIIAYTLSITQQQAEQQKVKVESIMEGPLPPLDCDSKQLKQVFINLIKNAIESMPDGGKIKINVKVLEGTKMYITIQDEGCGIDEESIPNLGEPFFTTKQDGTGLGLMVTNQIIKDHKGEFNIESTLSKGTKVNVTLPIAQN
jgi:signal transduction histidine kinase